MKVKNLLALLNQVLDGFGCKVVSSNAARHMSMIKSIRECGSELNLLEIAIQNELCKLKDKPFNVVQIGANDGNRYDPYSPLIRKYGLHGVLVEPIPEVYAKLVINYQDQPQINFENSAIGPNSGEMNLYMLCDKYGETDGLSVFASFSEEEVQKYRKQTNQALKVMSISVPVLTFETLRKKYALETVSLLAIDTEGFDYQILRSIDFRKIRPKIIEYEHSHLSVLDERECQRLLTSNGYQLHRIFGDDTIALAID
jgi:FkbM family methyltransferase